VWAAGLHLRAFGFRVSGILRSPVLPGILLPALVELLGHVVVARRGLAALLAEALDEHEASRPLARLQRSVAPSKAETIRACASPFGTSTVIRASSTTPPIAPSNVACIAWAGETPPWLRPCPQFVRSSARSGCLPTAPWREPPKSGRHTLFRSKFDTSTLAITDSTMTGNTGGHWTNVAEGSVKDVGTAIGTNAKSITVTNSKLQQ